MKSKKNRHFGPIIGLALLVLVGLLVWNNLREDKKQLQQITSSTASMPVEKSNLQSKTKNSQRESEVISLEVQQRLASAGFKTDSFISVKTENKTEKSNTNTTR